MKFLTIGLFALTLSLSAIAEEIKICTIVSDIDSEKTAMLIETNSNGDLDSVRLYRTMGNSVVSDETHPVEHVMDEGIVAAVREGRDVINLKANKFNVSKGGIITIDFLYNAIKNDRRTYDLKLIKVGENYELSTLQGTPVNHIKVIGNRLLGRVIGVKKVQVSYR